MLCYVNPLIPSSFHSFLWIFTLLCMLFKLLLIILLIILCSTTYIVVPYPKERFPYTIVSERKTCMIVVCRYLTIIEIKITHNRLPAIINVVMLCIALLNYSISDC